MPETIGYNRNNKIRSKLSKELQERLDRARERLYYGMQYRSMMREEAWSEAYDQYMNRIGWDLRDDTTADVINVNISFSTINTLVPFISDEAPEFEVEPYNDEADPESAAILTTILNRMWESNEIRGQVQLSNAAFDYLVYGDGWLKTGYKIAKRPEYDLEGNEIKGREQEIAEFMVDRVSPWDVWIDPYSDGLENARWVCQRILMPRFELENDDRYRLIKNDWEEVGSFAKDGSFAPEDNQRIDYFSEDDEWVAIYEYYDLVENYMISFTMDGPETPIRYVVGVKCPLVQLPNYNIPNSPYSIGELENIRSLQEELNKTRSQMITHRRRNVMKWVVKTDEFDDDALEAIRSSRINDIIFYDGNQPFESAIMAITPTPIATTDYALDNQIQEDINEITGVNDYLRGSAGVKRTATEASILEGATNVRTRHKLLAIEGAARKVGQLLLDIMSDVIPQTDFNEMSLYITGRDADKLAGLLSLQDQGQSDLVVRPSPENLKGKYVVFVKRGSTELRNPQLKAQKLKEMVQIMMGGLPILFQLQVPFDMRELLYRWFEAEGLKDVDSLFELDDNGGIMQQLMMAQAAQGATGPQTGDPRNATQGQGQAAGVGNRTQPGQARPSAAQPPQQQVTPQNSGMVPPPGGGR